MLLPALLFNEEMLPREEKKKNDANAAFTLPQPKHDSPFSLMEIDWSIRIPPPSSRWELFKTDSLCEIRLPRRINNSEGGGDGAASADLGRRFEMSSARTLPALHASYRSYIIAGQRRGKKKKRLTASRL